MAANGTSTHAPSARQPTTFTQSSFRITTQKLPILKAGPIEAMTDALSIAPPEMIFGDNYVSITHLPSGWTINFNAYDALDRVDKTGNSMLQVAHSTEWKRSREALHEGIKEVVRPFDWSYSTDYQGTVAFAESGAGASRKDFEACDRERQIPLELLRRPDPILFFDEVMLYEDELADNGTTILSIKLRVMPQRMLLLQRFFMRLDDVLFRIRDTRVYVEFDTGEMLREYTAREEGYEAVRTKVLSRGEDITSCLRDANKLAEMIPVKERKIEMVALGA